MKVTKDMMILPALG